MFVNIFVILKRFSKTNIVRNLLILTYFCLIFLLILEKFFCPQFYSKLSIYKLFHSMPLKGFISQRNSQCVSLLPNNKKIFLYRFSDENIFLIPLAVLFQNTACIGLHMILSSIKDKCNVCFGIRFFFSLFRITCTYRIFESTTKDSTSFCTIKKFFLLHMSSFLIYYYVKVVLFLFTQYLYTIYRA